MILSDRQILTEIEKGTIKVEPFRRECLGTNSYDVHLGPLLAVYKDAVLDSKKHNKIETWWPVIQLAGKDNLRQQAAMWQAMLMSAGLSPSRQILIHGFIASGGQKMSKSLGNVINPFDLVRKYGTDAVRYFLLRHVNPFEDSDVTLERFKELYNGNLANGLGNLVSRVMKMATANNIKFDPNFVSSSGISENDAFVVAYNQAMENYNFSAAMDAIWGMVSWADRSILKLPRSM
jgi:methionyl-tRNA synthetase